MTPPLALSLIDKAFAEKATFLDLGDCGLTAIPEELIPLAPFLRELNLGTGYYRNKQYAYSQNKGSTNNFSGSEVNFSGLQHLHLTGLYLSQTRIAEIPLLQIIQYLPKLTSLQISNNSLTATGAQHLAQLLNLTSLDISNNELTATGAQHLAQLLNLTSLDVSRNELTDTGVQHLAQLQHLASLQISSNQLTDAGAQHLAKLLNLTSLNISGNQLTAIGAQHLAQLHTLTWLDISGNQLTSICAQHLAQLHNLTWLDISGNQLTDTGAQHLAQLHNLTSLNIFGNQLTDTGAQHLAQLHNLTWLDISFNQLTANGFGLLVALPRLITFHGANNKADTIPEDILFDLKALRDYFQATERIDNQLVKIILTGNTTAGKSSLADYLINKKFDPDRKSTHGIQLWKWIMDPKNPDNSLTVNIWDFGGQDYYHATHTLFLSDKTLFLLLHTDKETHEKVAKEAGQYLSEAYWLGNIKSLAGDDSLTWFVQSKYEPDDEPLETKNLDTNGVKGPTTLANTRLFLEPGLATSMVRNQFTISVKKTSENDADAVLGFEFFRQSLLAELRKLARQKLPRSWVEIRDKHLPAWREENLQLTVTEFWEKCKAVFEDNSPLQKDYDELPIGLLAYLNGCGEIVWFRHTPALAACLYLSAATLTAKLFDILKLTIKDNQGVFTLSGLADADKTEVEAYLKILTEFKLIFKASGTADTFIIPQYLPENPYTRHFQQLIQVAYVIRFAHYMPRSLVTRFLVQYGNTEGSYYWRYGAFFKRGSFHLFVQMDVQTQTATIHISEGPTREKYTILRELFQFFTLPEAKEQSPWQKFSSSMEEKRNPERTTLSADDKRIIQLSSDGTEFVPIADLENAIQNKLTKVKSTDGNYISIGPVMHQLLTDGATTPKKIFLSYAHKDEVYKKELDTHF